MTQADKLMQALLNETKAARAWRDLDKTLPPPRDMDTEWLIAACKEKREAFDRAREETDKVLEDEE